MNTRENFDDALRAQRRLSSLIIDAAERGGVTEHAVENALDLLSMAAAANGVNEW